ncbi:hypothetical protein [Methanobrevibacter sp. V74]|uniref:hypothetical protein n=1 Tax=Methanobrevibacter sp. V74 TaxID=3064279 RepID=UPI0027335A27|nr:hypothetical protein [Methanobrevibacter sp. V74]
MYLISNYNSEVDLNITKHSEDVGVIPLIDENGNTQYVEARVYTDEGKQYHE